MLFQIALWAALAQPTADNFRQWGLEAVGSIQRDLLMPDGRLYGETAEPGKRPPQVAFNWSVGVMIEALDAASQSEPKLKSRLDRYIQATRIYWNPAPPVAGYDVLPVPKRADRYYDDNEWMVLALAEASEVLGSKRILGYARETYRFVASGEDLQLGGGVYWRESGRTSKNTCSNAPAAAAALALYRRTGDKAYLREGTELYAWTRAHLRDSDDGLYWDNISLKGKIERTKWSYNSGLMLRSAAELFDLTKDERYAEDAMEIQRSSLKHWVSPNGALKDEGKFMFLLLENWLLAYRLVPNAENPQAAIFSGLTYLHENGMDGLGHFGNRWDQPKSADPHPHFNLIDQAAAARAFLVAAEVLKKK